MASHHLDDPRSRLRRPTLVVAVALALATLLGLPAAAQDPTEGSTPPALDQAGTVTWSVRPTPTDAEPERPNFSFDVAGDDTLEDSIRVRNFGAEPLALDIYASDALTTSSGALDLLPAGEEPVDVGAWIELATDELEIEPGEAVDVPFTMTVPDNAEPGDHMGGIVTSFTSASEDDEGEAVVLDRRLGSRVQVRVGGELQPTLEIRDLEVVHDATANPFTPGRATVTYTVANIGNVRLAADQQVVVPGPVVVPDRVVTPEAMPELLPDNTLSFAVEVPAVWPSFRTTAEVTLEAVATREGDAFDVAPVTASAATTSIPWAQLAVLLVLVLLVAWIAWSRQRRQRREEAIRAEARAEAEQAVRTPGPGAAPGDPTTPGTDPPTRLPPEA